MSVLLLALATTVTTSPAVAQDESNDPVCWVCDKDGCNEDWDPELDLGWWGGDSCSERTWTDCDQEGCQTVVLCRTSGDRIFLKPPDLPGDPGSEPPQRRLPEVAYPVSPAVFDQVVGRTPLLGPFLIPLEGSGRFHGTVLDSDGTSYRYQADLTVAGDSALLIVDLKKHPEIESLSLELWDSGHYGVLEIHAKGATVESIPLGD